MRFALLSALAVPAAVVASQVHQARQDPPSSSPAASSPVPLPSSGSVSASAPSVSGTVPVSGSSVAAPITTLPSVSFSLQATNPTAIPLSEITAGTLTTSPTLPLSTVFAPGATPTFLTNPPPLPDLSKLVVSNYPPLDKPPPTDSPEVQQWIQEVANTGVQIPDISPTVLGGCPANLDAVSDPNRCWWTCGGCTRDTDIVTCPDKLTWGLTHDDGPAPYTSNLLQYLDSANLKTTFFVVGSRVISYPALLQEEFMAQHQIAVHTWSHPQMTTLSNEEAIAELGWTKKVIKDVLGVTPQYWRPPYGDIDDRIRAISKAMDLTPIMWTRISPTATFDTDDFNVAGGLSSASQVLSNWQNILGNATMLDTGFIVLEHDLFAQSVDLATGYILPDALAFEPKLKIEPVISCLNKPMSDAYIETNDNKTNPPVVSGSQPVSFSSGQPGSAEATGGASNNGNNSGATTIINSPANLFAVASSAFLAVVAGVSMLF
ncbi:unnamed protein product [Somion occarium]|uniref:chitin deacetylase n=1 Tax=Somion occarium TaxID=3059160 RepID=A0ABP1CKY0_9APHY